MVKNLLWNHPRLWDESAQGGRGIKGCLVRRCCVYAELLASVLQARAELRVMMNEK